MYFFLLQDKWGILIPVVPMSSFKEIHTYINIVIFILFFTSGYVKNSLVPATSCPTI